MDLTEGTLLAGRVRYWQGREGYRTGIEPVLLAAACPARPGERVLDLGTGAGAALLCLAARVPGVRGLGVELDPAAAALARRNLAANGAGGIDVVEGDAAAFAASAPFDHAMSNPPWHDSTSTPSPAPGRRRAKQAGPGLLAGWCAAAARALRPGGSLTLALPAALAGHAFAALAAAGLGAPALFPLWPREGRPARLVLLQARRGARGPARVLPGVVLHAGAGWSAWADGVLREAAVIDWSDDAPTTKEGNAVPHASTRIGRAALLLALALLWGVPARAAEHLTADQVRAAVAGAPAGKVDLSGQDMNGDDLTDLDLSGANLARANLSGANLHGVKLVGADLTDADLTKADLTFAWIIRANFTRAKLRGATMQTVVTSAAMDNTPDQAAIFVGADLSEASVTVHFSYDDMRGANFSGAKMTVVMANQSMGMLRTEFMSANLDGADFTGAGLGHITFRFAKLNGARFNGADLSSADFTGAYLTGADFTGANVQGATFEGATLTDVKGLSHANDIGK